MSENMPFAHKSFRREPFSNFEPQESLLSTKESGDLVLGNQSTRSISLTKDRGFFSGQSFLARSLHLRSSSHSSVGSLHLFNVQIRSEKPSDHHSLYDVKSNAVCACKKPSSTLIYCLSCAF